MAGGSLTRQAYRRRDGSAGELGLAGQSNGRSFRGDLIIAREMALSPDRHHWSWLLQRSDRRGAGMVLWMDRCADSGERRSPLPEATAGPAIPLAARRSPG
jgi:hypothetical protein